MTIKRCVILTLLAVVLVAGSVYAQSTVVVRRVLGKVEIQRPGEAWRPAEVGMELPLRATISTGFNSQVVLEVGSSVLTLRALTRIRIDELETRENVAITGLSMPVGRIQAEVRTTGGTKTDFRVRSPVSTAAVRGTQFAGNGSMYYGIESCIEVTNPQGLGAENNEGETIVMMGSLMPFFGAPQRLINVISLPYVDGADQRSRRYFGDRVRKKWGAILINWD